MTFTATVGSGAGIPTGSITFKRGTALLGKVTLVGGTASYTTQPTQLPTGTNSITAVYGGDLKHAASTSPALPQLVNKATTGTVFTSQPNPSAAGQSVTLTANVSSGPGIPTGSVVFKKGSTTLGRVTLSNGSASLNTIFSTAGSYSLSAAYQGNGNYQASSASLVQTVQ